MYGRKKTKAKNVCHYTVPDHEHFIRYIGTKMMWNVTCIIRYPAIYRRLMPIWAISTGDCVPMREYLAAHCVTLPLFPEMREDEIARVIDLCNAYRQA